MKRSLFSIGLSLFSITISCNPKNPTVEKGTAAFQWKENSLEIHAGDRSIIQWENFSIDSQEITRFIQPDTSSITINKVITFTPSIINGTLAANGKVVLINPNGIVIGKDGVINTAEFIASTTDVFDNNWHLERGHSLNLSIGKGVINHQGIIQATEFRHTEGFVLLVAPEVIVDGTINAHATEILGNHIHLQTNASIDASAPEKGGTILVGGDNRGQNKEIYNSQSVIIEKGSVLKASGLETGDGGRVIVWSNNHTHFLGNIEAKGGDLQGNGGFVEISSPHHLYMGGDVTTLAIKGETGIFLLDPTTIFIGDEQPNSSEVIEGAKYTFSKGIESVNINIDSLLKQLENNNVIIDTAAPIDGGDVAGYMYINTEKDLLSTSPYSLTLKATRDINLSGAVFLRGGGSLTIECGGSYEQNTPYIKYSLGSLNTTKDGNISIKAQQDITIYSGNKKPIEPRYGVTDIPYPDETTVLSSEQGSIKLYSQNGSVTLDCDANKASMSILTNSNLEITALKNISILSSSEPNQQVVIQTKGPITMTTSGSLDCSGASETNLLSDGSISLNSKAESINLGGQNSEAISIKSTKQNITLQAEKNINIFNGTTKDSIIEIGSSPTAAITLQANQGNIVLTASNGPGKTTVSGGQINLHANQGDLSLLSNMGGQILIDPNSSIHITAKNLTLTAEKTLSKIGIIVNSSTNNLSTVFLSKNCTIATTECGEIEFTTTAPLELNAKEDIFVQNNGDKSGSVVLGVLSKQTGALHLTAGKTITIGPKTSIILPCNDTAILKANHNIILKENSIITCPFPKKIYGPNQRLLLIVDNQCPLAPKKGKGQFLMDSTATIAKLTHHPILIFTVKPSQNSIKGEIAEEFFVPNKAEIDTLEEKWGIYYSQQMVESNDSHFIILYKDKAASGKKIPPPNYTNEILTTIGTLFDSISSSTHKEVKDH
jgi:filamentous hemagglutinin family protein